ncbi:outer membrane beta-barrel protein [Pseudomonas sp. CBMAI 2609]|uniref:Outer membrane beta-barrel protein n=1 Tax=Pseudomonas flavocrustae TaxID=2991719 RepID=A0ABT6II78_9PSED|nr:OmpW family outer membrane protein [Pseudomonas sp. CBMAI 2609]MDH4764131.1 outer membrane beta-barrel protein [Pseudomonas sp. CBMAI 2609]
MGRRARTYVSLSVFGVVIALSSGTVTAANSDGIIKGPKQADWLVRGSVLSVRSLTQKTEIPVIGGQIKSSDKTLPGLDISYFFTDHWAIEFQGGHVKRSYAVSGSGLGGFSVGSIDSGALSLTLQYHFRPTASVKPYVGAGANYAWTRSVQPAQNIPRFDVKPVTSALIAAGVDIAVAPGWLVNASARYLLSPEYDFKGEGFNAAVKINTLVIGMGVGFYF